MLMMFLYCYLFSGTQNNSISMSKKDTYSKEESKQKDVKTFASSKNVLEEKKASRANFLIKRSYGMG